MQESPGLEGKVVSGHFGGRIVGPLLKCVSCCPAEGGKTQQ